MKAVNVTCKVLMIAAVALMVILLIADAIANGIYLPAIIATVMAAVLVYGIFQSGKDWER